MDHDMDNIRALADRAGDIELKNKMNQHEFMNRLRSLHNIDGDQLPEFSLRERNAFLVHPVKYFLTARDDQANAIWREIEKRQ